MDRVGYFARSDANTRAHEKSYDEEKHSRAEQEVDHIAAHVSD